MTSYCTKMNSNAIKKSLVSEICDYVYDFKYIDDLRKCFLELSTEELLEIKNGIELKLEKGDRAEIDKFMREIEKDYAEDLEIDEVLDTIDLSDEEEIRRIINDDTSSESLKKALSQYLDNPIIKIINEVKRKGNEKEYAELLDTIDLSDEEIRKISRIEIKKNICEMIPR